MAAESGSSKYAQITGSASDAYIADVQKSILKAMKLAVALPADINFNRAIDNDFAREIDSCSVTTLELANRLLGHSTSSYATNSRVKGKNKLEGQEDVVDSFGSLVVDVLDQLFERVDMKLDEYLGRNKPSAVPVKSFQTASSAKTSTNRSGRLDPSILHAAHISKPQLCFKRRMDNSNVSWTPKLKHKYNAQVPLGFTMYDSADADEGGGLDSLELKRAHPYLYEIKHISYPRHMFEHRESTSPLSFENTPFTWIDTKGGLESLLDKLRRVQEIAIDLEHHSYRSFSGFVCLMQISTRKEDFIVDTLALREELEDLNEIFTDPKVVKVLHGADSDVVWLQQDFNIYIVNLFDTYHASRVLDFPRHGLGALLEMYCDFVPDKRYQLADWRIRPLRDEMTRYARADTHFLLYVYDNLRNALLDRAGGLPDLVQAVLDRSQETALRVYKPEVYDLENGNGTGGWNALTEKWGRTLSGMQLAVFRAVHAWRDVIARTEDESTRYVLPNHYVFQLAERPPADMAALLAVFRPIPPLVRTKATSLLEVIRTAVKEALSKAGNTRDIENAGHLQTTLSDTCKELLRTSISHEASVHSKKASSSIEGRSSGLWTRHTVLTKDIAATSSSLLGSQSIAGRVNVTAPSSDRSTLFPKGWTLSKSATEGIDATIPRYQEAVSRIHSSLVASPSIPNASITTSLLNQTEPDETSPNDVVPGIVVEAVSEQIEVPFVPARERQTHSLVTKVENDAIISVGRTRDRKRKRSSLAESTIIANKDVKKVKGEVTDVNGIIRAVEPKPEEFDYGSAPNFLDEPIMDQSIIGKPQKGKTSKGRVGFEYGSFPAPPRTYNAVKGANVSHTFR
ncbi:RRP6 [Sanghuangporus sanghuang]